MLVPVPWLKQFDLLIFDRIDSTNDEAIRLLKAGVRGNFVIIAREQNKGKGQKGKSWQSINGNLHASILIKSDLSFDRLKELSFLTAVAIHDAILECISDLKAPTANINLKWPNDILIGNKKVAGILLEAIKVDNKNYLVIGIGANTHFVPKIEGVEVTSLLNEGVILRNSDDFLSKIMDNFQFYYDKWQTKGDFSVIRDAWLKSAYNLNKSITLNNGVQLISGVFKGIDQEGAICVELSNGQQQCFSSGEVTYISDTSRVEIDEAIFEKELGVPSRGAEPTSVGEHRKVDGNDNANFSNIASIRKLNE